MTGRKALAVSVSEESTTGPVPVDSGSEEAEKRKSRRARDADFDCPAVRGVLCGGRANELSTMKVKQSVGSQELIREELRIIARGPRNQAAGIGLGSVTAAMLDWSPEASFG